MSISEDDSVLASGALDGSVKVFSFPQLAELLSFETVLLWRRLKESSVLSVAFCPRVSTKGHYRLYVAHADGRIDMMHGSVVAPSRTVRHEAICVEALQVLVLSAGRRRGGQNSWAISLWHAVSRGDKPRGHTATHGIAP